MSSSVAGSDPNGVGGKASSCGTVLVVEDEPDIRETLAEILRDEGLRAVEVANGAEALSYLERERPPCLILLDLMMPVMDGWEFLQRYRASSLLQAPVIVITGGNGGEEGRPVVEVLSKPPDLSVLLRRVAALCTC